MTGDWRLKKRAFHTLPVGRSLNLTLGEMPRLDEMSDCDLEALNHFDLQRALYCYLIDMKDEPENFLNAMSTVVEKISQWEALYQRNPRGRL